jgi:hypothetical protein
LKRDLAYMKDRLHAPIVFDRDKGGYRFERDGKRKSARSTNCPDCGSPPKKSMPC